MAVMFARIVACGLGAALLVAGAHPRSVGTIREQVRRAKRELDTRATLREYHESPYQPSEIVERIHQLESGDAWSALCAELAQLPDEELELFEDEIRKPEHARRMPCAEALVRRIEAYWKQAERRLDLAHPIGPAGRLPSEAVQVDTLKPGVMTGDDFGPGRVALTFDDGPHPTRTPRVLAILAAAGVRATFFQIGRNAAAHPETARSVPAAGHTVGSHTFSHPNMSKLDERHAETEVDAGDASVSLALGLRPGELPFFRFPYGAKTPREQTFVERRGNTTFFWNMDSLDWRIRDPHRLFLNVLAELDRARGGIILFHDIHEQTVIVLPHVLAELRARGMKTVVFVAPLSAPRAPSSEASP
jgi:peptidoglycan/xylan/chitin deacetylase (PgdA/CDA1 family)